MQTTAARGYRTRTPSIQTKSSISCACDQQWALLHASDRSPVDDRLAQAQPGAAATCMQTRRMKKEQHTRQFYPTVVLVPSIRKTDAKSDWLQLAPGNASRRCLAAASSAGAYLKRKLRAKLLILSIPRLSRGELLERKTIQLWHQASHGRNTGRE
jgi:hypothetical protein